MTHEIARGCGFFPVLYRRFINAIAQTGFAESRAKRGAIRHATEAPASLRSIGIGRVGFDWIDATRAHRFSADLSCLAS